MTKCMTTLVGSQRGLVEPTFGEVTTLRSVSTSTQDLFDMSGQGIAIKVTVGFVQAWRYRWERI